MRNKHKYDELLPEEFDAEMKDTPIIYCAFGPMEYHGVYNTLGIDPVKAYDICIRAAKVSGGVVFPMVPIAPGGSMQFDKMLNRDGLRNVMRKQGYPSIMTSVDLCMKLYYELFENFAEDLGAKVCVAFGGHGPASVLIQKIYDDNKGKVAGMQLLPCGSLSHNMDIIKAEYAKLGIEKIQHGGLWETAMNAGVNPDFVQLKKINQDWPDCFEKYNAATLEGLKGIDSKELVNLGEKILQISAVRIATEAKKLIKSTSK